MFPVPNGSGSIMKAHSVRRTGRRQGTSADRSASPSLGSRNVQVDSSRCRPHDLAIRMDSVRDSDDDL